MLQWVFLGHLFVIVLLIPTSWEILFSTLPFCHHPAVACTSDKSTTADLHCYRCTLLDEIYRSIVFSNCCCPFWAAACCSPVIFCWNIKWKKLLAYHAWYQCKHVICLFSGCFKWRSWSTVILRYFPWIVWGFSHLPSYSHCFLRHPVSSSWNICFLASFRSL